MDAAVTGLGGGFAMVVSAIVAQSLASAGTINQSTADVIGAACCIIGLAAMVAAAFCFRRRPHLDDFVAAIDAHAGTGRRSAMLAAALDCVGVMVAVVGVDGVITHANRHFSSEFKVRQGRTRLAALTPSLEARDKRIEEFAGNGKPRMRFYVWHRGHRLSFSLSKIYMGRETMIVAIASNGDQRD